MAIVTRLTAPLLGLALAALLGGCAALFPPSPAALLDNVVVYSPPLKRNLVLRDGGYRDRASNIFARLIQVTEGELGGDRGRDAAGVLEVISASAGTHYQLVTVVTVNGRRQASSIYLGRRLQLEGLTIAGGQVRLALKRNQPGDRPCCPSLRVSEAFRWQQGRLAEVKPGLGDSRWELVELWGRPVQAQPLPHLSFSQGRATGFGGCNDIALDFTARDQSIRFDGVGGGQKYCADTPEEDFIGALIQVDRFDWKGPLLELYSGGEVLARMRPAR
jgi:hypothetical protein